MSSNRTRRHLVGLAAGAALVIIGVLTAGCGTNGIQAPSTTTTTTTTSSPSSTARPLPPKRASARPGATCSPPESKRLRPQRFRPGSTRASTASRNGCPRDLLCRRFLLSCFGLQKRRRRRERVTSRTTQPQRRLRRTPPTAIRRRTESASGSSASAGSSLDSTSSKDVAAHTRSPKLPGVLPAVEMTMSRPVR